ncbi:MAG: hypothetical protein ACXWAT_15145 [Methylobacter sp.]
MVFSAPAIVILIGTVLASIGALWTSYKQDQFESDLKDKQKTLEAKNEEIIRLNHEIAVLSQHTTNMVTGGDSYAYILFSDNQSTTIKNVRLGSVFLIHEGRYPLYDLTIQIADIDAHKDIKVFSVGNVGSIQHVKHWPLNQMINFDLTGKQSQRFNIFFYGRNGFWYQQMIYKKLENNWALAVRVVRPNEKGGVDVLFKSISPDFPIPEKNITWE